MRYRQFGDKDPEFTTMPLVFIEVRGRIVKEFYKWVLDNKIYYERSGGMSGLGRASAYYTAEVAEKVLAWLKEKGATQKDEVPSWSVKE